MTERVLLRLEIVERIEGSTTYHHFVSTFADKDALAIDGLLARLAASGLSRSSLIIDRPGPFWATGYDPLAEGSGIK